MTSANRRKGVEPPGFAPFLTGGRLMLKGLERLSATAGVPLTPDHAEAMRTFWRFVLETNEHTNLTRITADRDAVLKHFVDSLTVLKTDVVFSGARLVDIGTGA